MNPQRRTIRDADAEKKGVRHLMLRFLPVRERTVASCGWLAARLKIAEHRERKSDVEKNRMEEPFEEAAPNAGQYMRRKEVGCICTMTPSFAWLGMHSAANVNLPIHCTKKGTKRGENSSR